MNLTQYYNECQRTCPSIGSVELDLLHMDLGIITEIGEFLDIFKKHLAYGKPIDYINVLEEASDQIWYLTNKLRIEFSGDNEDYIKNQLETAQYRCDNLPELYLSIEDVCESYLEFSKYVKDNEYQENISFIYSVCKALGLNLFDGLQKNIDKLKIRFPNKFTQENALNRDLEAEYKVL